MEPAPKSILIIGAGIFGLSTAIALLRRPRYANTHLTIVDAAESIPNQHGSSVDASRIIRPDYSDPVYAKLAAEAQVLWRDQSSTGWGGEGRYFEPGFLLTADGVGKVEYLRKSLDNVRAIAEEAAKAAGGPSSGKGIEVLEGGEQIKKASGYEHASDDWGYVNWSSGWGDAARIVDFMAKKVGAEGGDRVTWELGANVDKLLVKGNKVLGAQVGNKKLHADLTILAAGAWSGSLINLKDRALATGQALTYVDITTEEENAMKNRPTVINMSRGTFIIPPRHKLLKVARHGFGYLNPVKIPSKNILGCDQDSEVEVSLPWNGIEVPKEGVEACREALRELVPSIGDRSFVRTRVCWYCDTPTGNFIITSYPDHLGLFVATGGSGHGFKFAPVIGDRIVDGIEGRLDPTLKNSWKWPDPVQDFSACEDGSRAGPRGMILKDEMAKP